MTVSSTGNRISYSTDGSSVDFVTDYPVLVETDLFVYLVAADESFTLLTLNSDYTVAGADGDVATVTTVVTYPNDGSSILIVRDAPLTQEVDYVNNDKNDAEVQEQALDKMAMVDQQLNTLIERSIRLPETFIGSFDPTLPIGITGSAGLAIAINDTTDGLMYGASTSSAVGPLRMQSWTRADLIASGGEIALLEHTSQLRVLAVSSGGGGASSRNASASKGSTGGGGGSGAECDIMVQLPTAGGTLTGWSIGAKGTGATAGNNDATAGGDTVMNFGFATVTLTGGQQGPLPGAIDLFNSLGGGSGGVTGVDFINMKGCFRNGKPGQGGFSWVVGASVYGYSGRGGDSQFGPAVEAVLWSDTRRPGDDAVNYGTGGNGGLALNNNAAHNGGDGAEGYIVIYEYGGSSYGEGIGGF